MKKIKGILLATAVAVGSVGLSAGQVEAGSSCYAPTALRSGDYVTYSSYGSGNWYHRVRVVRDGVWRSGPWIAGDGYSRITLYHPNYVGVAICQVLT